MSLKNVVIYQEGLFDLKTGSGHSLLINIAEILANDGQFHVWCLYGFNGQELFIPKILRHHERVTCVPLTFIEITTRPPWKPKGIERAFNKIIKQIGPTIFVFMVSSGDQWPITSLSSGIPLLLISPFGDFCSNGNVRKLYVSGHGNVDKLRRMGISIGEAFYNPILSPPKRDNITIGPNDQVIFGRIGRGDANLFDPISLKAFAKIENEYGDQAIYYYINPSPEARELVQELGLKQVVFKNWLSRQEVEQFLSQIHVLAHARRDGETLGVAIGEAMLHECAIATHKSAFFNEHLFLVREPYGLVAELDDVDHYARNLRWFMENRNLLPELGRQARDFASNYFDYDIVGKKIVTDCEKIWTYVGHSSSFLIQLHHTTLRFKFWLRILRKKIKKVIKV